MDASKKLASERLAVLQLAERLGNAAEACRRCGVDRTSFYQWKRRLALEGVEGLANRPPVHKSHPQTTPADLARQIAALALAHPAHGCDRIETNLAKRGIDVSAVTIQKILHKAGLGTYQTRAVALEDVYLAGGRKLSSEQMAFLENSNPCFRERHKESTRAGEYLCAGTFFLGRFDNIGPVYVHAVIDSFSSYAFAALSTTTQVETTLHIIRKRVLPFSIQRRLKIHCVATGRTTMLARDTIAGYLKNEGIKHELLGGDQPNGFVERFRRTVVEDFLRLPEVRRLSRAQLARLQECFDSWVVHYNAEKQLQGYRNYGKTPAARL